MSEHMSRERAMQLVEQFSERAREVEYLAGQLRGPQFGGLKDQGLAASGALAHLAEQLAASLGPVRRDPGSRLREIGANTRRGLERLAGNRGRQ